MKRKTDLLVILAFAFFSIIIFRTYFFTNRVPFPANLLVSAYSPWRNYEWEGYPFGPPAKPMGYDDLRIFYPYRKLITDQLRKGQWPLWNPYNFSGNVHLATYQSPVFYPLNFFYFILPQIDAWSLLVILQPILSGTFMYLFLKKINLSKKASFFGAFAFALSGWMLVWIEEDLVKEHSVLWLPLILYAIEKINEKASAGNIVLLVFSVVSSILAGFLQLTLYVFMAVFAWIFFRYQRLKRKDLKKLLILGLAFLFSFLISSVHIWPAVEAYFFSPRGAADAKFLFDDYLMSAEHLITFLAPDFWGNPGVFNYFKTDFYHEKMIYIGIPAFLLALYALFSKRKDKTLRFFKWFSLITLALGFSPLGWLLYYSRLPLLSTMIPSRIFILPTFGFCILSAFGLDLYFKQKVNWQRWKKLFLVIGGIFLILWLFILYQRIAFPQGKYARVSLRNLVLPTGFFASSLVVILFPRLKNSLRLVKKLSSQRAKFLSFLGLMTLAIFSSFYFANKFIYFSERRFVFPETPVITELKKISGVNRVWGDGDAYFERNMCTYYDLHCPGGYDALFPKRYGELLYTTETGGEITHQIPRCDAELEQALEKEGVLDNWYRRRLLSLLGTKYIIESKARENEGYEEEQERFPKKFFQLAWEDEKFKIWEYLEALPRFFLVNDYLVEKDKQKIVDYLFDEDFDLSKKVILEENPDLEISRKKVEGQQAKLVSYAPNRVELKTESPTTSLLFLSDNYYPGWKAFIGGEEAEILRANYSFRAVVLPAGKHEIVLSYEPGIFYWGLRVSALSLVLFISWMIFVRIWPKRS